MSWSARDGRLDGCNWFAAARGANLKKKATKPHTNANNATDKSFGKICDASSIKKMYPFSSTQRSVRLAELWTKFGKSNTLSW